MSRYRIRFHGRPELRYASLLGEASSLGQALAPLLDTIGDIEFRPAQGGETVQLVLSRPSRDEVFNDVVVAVQRLGYSMVEAEIREVVTRTVEGAICGSLGTGAVGSTIKNPYLTLLAAVIGAVAGAKAGSLVEVASTKHRYQWFPATGWVVREAGAPQGVSAAAQNAVVFGA